jgi:hypothetical protein
MQVTDGEVDDPDLALRLGEGLQESTAGEITTVTHSVADANIYRYACSLHRQPNRVWLGSKRCGTLRGSCRTVLLAG